MKKVVLLMALFAGTYLSAQNTIPSTRVAGSMKVDSTVIVSDSMHVLSDLKISGETTLKDTVHAQKDIKVDGNLYVNGIVASPVYRVGPDPSNTIASLAGNNFSVINFGSANPSAVPANPSCVTNYPANGTILVNRMILKDQSGVTANTFDFRNDGQNGYIEYPTPGVVVDPNIPPHIIKIGNCDNTNVEIANQPDHNFSTAGFVSLGRNLEIGNPTRSDAIAMNVKLKTGLTKALSINDQNNREVFKTLSDGQTTINYSGTFSNPAFIVTNATPSAVNGMIPPYFSVLGDGKVFISKPSNAPDNDAIVIKNPATGQIDYKVKNDGSVFARYMKVTLGNFPDYVFEKHYALMPLKEVEAFIQSNKHLPNIPAAAIVEKEGADLGELQRLNIEKTEEIFLYLIQLNKRVEALEAENAALKTQILKK